jgi:small-conductance mechanosensitive channel
MSYTFLGNGAVAWSIALAVMLFTFAIVTAVKKILVRHLSAVAVRTETYLDDVAVSVLASTSPVFIGVVALFAGAQALAFTPRATLFVANGIVVAGLLQVALWCDLGIKEWLFHYRRNRNGNDAASTTSTAALGFVARAITWLLIILMILDNFGVNITTLVASLGIGGIAVALALQNILGDLFSSLSIVLDKPFVIGDFIIVDDVPGTVEFVGLKTTRLRGLGGEQVVFSNSAMLKSRIHNYKRMQTRRIAFQIGVTYQTSPQQLQAMPGLIRDIVASQAQATFDRAHFKSFGASSYDFEIVYIVKSADFNIYMDIQQAINLALVNCFARESIEFAYPTQTLYHVGVAPPAVCSQQAPGASLREEQSMS